MLRQMIKIDEDACTGCGLCVSACHEGALVMQDGKARLIRDDYCDGLGNCLPACPAGAISFEMREAAAYDEEAVKRHLADRDGGAAQNEAPKSCPGVKAQTIRPLSAECGAVPAALADATGSELRQWPVQIKLAPVNAPFFREADVLIAADCTAFACGDFHTRFMRGRVTLIGCTKLDDTEYSEKLAEIFRQNDVNSVTVARMDVPCCGGMEHAVSAAIRKSGRDIPCVVTIVGRDGQIMKSETLSTEAAPLLRTL
ncbi:ATP-binding protein [Mailhella sp.]|uniref:ATP-binding protein n=1 Tax=Mailhella sp. TaxID=1981029 RepID=UPI0040643229